LTQANAALNNHYDISSGYIHYYSGDSTTPNTNLFTSRVGSDQWYEFAPGNFGDISSTTGMKLNISEFGVRFGAFSAGVVAGSDIHVGYNSQKTGTLGFDGITSGKVTVTVNAAAGTWTMTLPTTAGSSGQFLQTDGTGITTWATSGGGGGGLTGSGTTNYFPRWTGVSSLSSTSSIYQGTEKVGLIAMTSPTAELHIDRGTGNSSFIKFTTGTITGQTSTDGFDIGIQGTGIAEINQRENNDLVIYTNNTERVRISGSTGSFEFGGSGIASRINEFSFAPWQFQSGTAGTAEYSRVISGTQTSNGTLTEIYTTGNLNTNARISIPSGKIIGFNCDIVAYNITSGSSSYVRKRGLIRNLAGTTALIGSITTETIHSNFAAGSSASVSADNTNDALAINVTGVTSQVVRWMVTTELYELGFT